MCPTLRRQYGSSANSVEPGPPERDTKGRVFQVPGDGGESGDV